ncbi:MAG: tRNA-intron lyase [Archaeoglobaceae archaeon]|nr:tRNA-intron lyase [Archaeoglobaceae archaeon]MDW8127708.1 tRNA-intron lyase [Archaeoglobaceae archaeon]
MKGKIVGDLAELNADRELKRRGFGIQRGDKIYLHPIEAFYLQMRGDAFFEEEEELKKWVEEKVKSFPEFYFVYEDLRNRGYKAKPNGELIIAKKVFYPISEKNIIKLNELIEAIRKFGELVLAIVDEESEITYYLVSQQELQGEQLEELPKIRGSILKDRVITENVEIFRKYFYGSEISGLVVLSLFESLYLFENGFLELDSPEKLYEIVGNLKDFEERYRVYKDLKKRNFVVKTGFKFGSDFRIYRKVSSVEDLPHSEFLVWIVKGDLIPRELARAVRLSNSVRKKLLLTYKDLYLLFDRVKV